MMVNKPLIKANATKGKQKGLPKLKTILANPYKSTWSSLTDTELQDLQKLLSAAVDRSELEPRAFAASNGICIGLESVLRSVNSRRAACVFLSLSIKPRHVLNLITRNAEIKNACTSVYALPQLEQFTEHVYGVRAVAFSLPIVCESLGNELRNWIIARLKTMKEKPHRNSSDNTRAVKITRKKKEFKQLYKPINDNMTSSAPKTNPKKESWSGDFISFSSASDAIQIDALKLEEDETMLQTALNVMASKSEILTSDVKQATFAMELDTLETTCEIDNNSDSDDFLQDYQALQVHKIRPNPDKKPKKKRNKKKILK